MDDESYQAESYFGDEDWFDDPLAKLTDSCVKLTDSTNPAGLEQAPPLPVFAVWTGSSRAAVVPSSSGDDNGNGSTGWAATAQPLELLVAPFSAGARTPVPRIDSKPGLKFDARWGFPCSIIPSLHYTNARCFGAG